MTRTGNTNNQSTIPARTREGTWRLYFDLTGISLVDTDGIKNPAWLVAADRYNVVGGDLGPVGMTWVAIHTAHGDTLNDPGVHFGRDGQGRAVKLVPVEDVDDAPREGGAALPTILDVRHDASIRDAVVTVDPYRTTDRDGRTVEVDQFYGNGGLITCEGHRVKADGMTYARRSVLFVSVPANVRKALGR